MSTEQLISRAQVQAGFSLTDFFIPIKNLPQVIRTSLSDISPSTFKRFFFPKHGNKERFGSLAMAVFLSPFVFRDFTLSVKDKYRSFSDGKVILIRDFELFVRASAFLGFRGESVPELHFRWAPHDAFSAVQEKYGECPFGKWEHLRYHAAHLYSQNRYPEQVPAIEKIIDDCMASYLGKTVEIGTLFDKILWDCFTYGTYGIQPDEESRRRNDEYNANQPEFDYAVRVAGLNVPYEWSPSLTTSLSNRAAWSLKLVEDRIANIESYKHQADVLTDNIINHEYDKMELEGQLRGCYSGGYGSTHSAICGALIHNSTTRGEPVHEYFMKNPKETITNIVKEALRLYTHVPLSRTVTEEDDFELDGKKLAPGTAVFASTFAVATDPRLWDKPMDFEPARFENDSTHYGYMTQTGLTPFGADCPNIGSGGRSCSGRVFIEHVTRTVLYKVLRDYKFVAPRGGFWDFQFKSGGCRYKGKCMVRVEKR